MLTQREEDDANDLANFGVWTEGQTLKIIWSTGYGSELITLRTADSMGIWFVLDDGRDGFAPWSSILSLRTTNDEEA